MPLQLKPRQGPSPLPFTFDSPPPSPLVASGSDVTGVPRDAREGKLAPRPPADFIPERDMNMFGMYPLSGSGDLGRGLVKCARCQRPTMESAFAEHQREYTLTLPHLPIQPLVESSSKVICVDTLESCDQLLTIV
jgi:SAGA-associated factor 73